MAAAAMAVAKKHGKERQRSKKGIPIDGDVVSVFEKYDKDGSDNIDAHELLSVMRDLERPVKLKHAEDFIAVYNEGDSDEKVLSLATFGDLWKELNDFAPKEPFTKDSVLGKGHPLPLQKEVRKFYCNPIIVWTVASIIIANFVVNILEKEIDPDLLAPKYPSTWENLDLAFNIIFLVELLVNMYGYGGPTRAFFRNGWNVFDFIIVSVGCVMMSDLDLGEMSKLKLLRAFRVFRLFKRVKSLNKIIVALIGAIPGVFNAFVILFIFFCIYAILAVELFRDFGSNGTYVTNDIDEVSHLVSSETARGYTNGIEYYGTYSRAMYTLFQVMTGESWSEAVVRPLLFGLYQDSTFTVGFFYVSFIILTQMVLTNVVVAVLLDEFVGGDGDAEELMTDEMAELFIAQLYASEGKVRPSSSAVTTALGTPMDLPPSEAINALPAKVEHMDASIRSLEKKLDQLLTALASPPIPHPLSV
eukprot:CAMPEP_0115848002 /NCGR_PEP_ID=MMETSP0287-20121206/10686_1 /TAXON_ID=412157 /ORGANISM="Chrysochromulina rotalis, Strain UIO044" /LENGTH=472 /DNA_ID=CAMNT_0003301879 /DNA_START=83 /DNA_END=1501 /DNA_ORIENTATION=-